MKKNFLSVALVLALASMSFTTVAQTWNAQQAEVLKNVEAYWAAYSKGDAAGFLSYFSEDYVGWSNDSPMPDNKQITAKFVTYGLANKKTLFYHLNPVTIKVYGDIAIVNYYYTTHSQNVDNEKKWQSGRWTDILKKQGDKWVIVADHGGEDDED